MIVSSILKFRLNQDGFHSMRTVLFLQTTFRDIFYLFVIISLLACEKEKLLTRTNNLPSFEVVEKDEVENLSDNLK